MPGQRTLCIANANMKTHAWYVSTSAVNTWDSKLATHYKIKMNKRPTKM